MANPEEGRTPNLLDVFHKLPVDSRDQIVRSLQDSGSSRNLRATCQALRTRVDESLRNVTVVIKEHSTDLVTAGIRLPLHRWPRCSELTVELQDDHVVGDRGIMLPFTGATQEARHRITHLRVCAPWALQGFSFSGPVLSSLLLNLPNLQQVSITCGMPATPTDQSHLFNALKHLPRLEELELPASRALDHLGLLAELKPLRRLRVCNAKPPQQLDGVTIAAIGRLAQLQHLVVLGVHHPGTLAALLRGLPMSIQKVELPWSFLGSDDTNINFKQNTVGDHRIVGVEVSTCKLGRFLSFVGDGLQRSGKLQPPLQQVKLGCVCVDQEDERELSGPHATLVQTAMRGCRDLQVGHIRVDRTASSELVLQAVDLLCATPRGFLLQLNTFAFEHSLCVEVRSRPPGHGLQPPAGEDPSDSSPAAASAGQAQSAQLASLLDRALWELVGVAPQEVEPGDAADSRMLLLRGPLLDDLSRSPAELEAWLQIIAVVTKLAADGHVFGGNGARPLVSYCALPSAPTAAVIECRSSEDVPVVLAGVRAASAAQITAMVKMGTAAQAAAAAHTAATAKWAATAQAVIAAQMAATVKAAAAVRAAAADQMAAVAHAAAVVEAKERAQAAAVALAAAAAEASAGALPLVAAAARATEAAQDGAGEDSMPPLHVVRVKARQASSRSDDVWRVALEKAAQKAYDGSDGLSEGRSEHERLQWLLQQWIELRDAVEGYWLAAGKFL